jgi:hypothetical protein
MRAFAPLAALLLLAMPLAGAVPTLPAPTLPRPQGDLLIEVFGLLLLVLEAPAIAQRVACLVAGPQIDQAEAQAVQALPDGFRPGLFCAEPGP